LYKNVKQISFDLPSATQNKIVTNYAKTLTSILAVFVVSGCVSQQSAFDLGGTQPVQPVPTGVSLAGDPTANSSDTSSLTSLTASNIPVKAPRPSARIAQASIEPATGQSLQKPSAVVTAPQTSTTLAQRQM